MSLQQDFYRIAEEDHATSIDTIETRVCSTDNHEGVEYTFYGDFIAVQPIIDFIGKVDGKAIDEMYFANEHEDARLGIFVADVEQRGHPAFTP